MYGCQQKNQRGQYGNHQPDSVSGTLQQKIVSIFPFVQRKQSGEKQNQGYNIIGHGFHSLPIKPAAATPKPAEQMLVIQTAGKMSKGVAQPSPERTAATLAGIN